MLFLHFSLLPFILVPCSARLLPNKMLLFLRLAVAATILSGSYARGTFFRDTAAKLLQDREVSVGSAGSSCHVYGIDFVNGGNYFITSTSGANFTCVSQFDGCQGGNASILLVNDQDGAQYECSSIPTTPSNTSQLSTCPINQDQLTSGNWSIITLGDDAESGPFAWQRNFTLNVDSQQTTTVLTTVTYTLISTPITVVTCTFASMGSLLS